MERKQKPDHEPDAALRFVLDGVYYSVAQKQMTREQARENLKQWLPDAVILDKPVRTYPDDYPEPFKR